MPQKILENLYEKISAARDAAPEFAESLEKLVRLNSEFIGKETLNADELAELKRVYNDVNRNMTGMISNPGSVHADFAAYMPELKAAAAPLACYVKKLEANPANLGEVLSSADWVEGYLGTPERLQNEPEYDKKSFSTDGMTLDDAIDAYKHEAEKVKEGLLKHAGRLSGDSEMPIETLHAKLGVLGSFVGSFENEPAKSGFTETAQYAYDFTQKRFDYKNVNSFALHHGQIITENYFTFVMSKLFDYSVESGGINDMATVSPETKTVLRHEAKKLLLNREVLGISKESQNILTKTSAKFASIGNACDSLNYDSPDEISNPGSSIYPVYEEMKKCSDLVLARFHDSEGTRPITANDFTRFFDLTEQYVRNEEILNSDGSFKYQMKLVGFAAENIGSMYPELKERAEKIQSAILTKGKERFDEFTDEIVEGVSKKRMKAIMNTPLRSIENAGLVDRNYSENSRFYAMGANEDFCNYEIDRAKKALYDIVRTDEKTNNQGFSYFTNEYTGKSNPVDPSVVRTEICKTILLGSIIKKQKENGYIVNDRETARRRNEQLERNPVAKALFALPAKDLCKVLSDEKAVDRLTDTILDHGPGYFPLLNEKTLSALTQKSGNFGSTNSPEYEHIKDSIASIRNKGQDIEGPQKKDWLKLVDSCSKYLVIRSSEASSPNGKLRFSAASDVLRTIGPKLALSVPKDDRKRIQRDIVVNMMRSSDFRRQFVADAKKRIADAFGGADEITADKLTGLSDYQKKSIEQDVKLLTAAAALDKAMAGTKYNRVLAGKNSSKEDIDKIHTLASRMLIQPHTAQRLNADPCALLNELAGQRKPPVNQNPVLQ